MDRLEYIRIQVDTIIDRIQDPMIRRLAYTHTYGVSNNAALLATLRHIDYELACISAMLHDLSIYAENHPHRTHAQRSAQLAKELLAASGLFCDHEIQQITLAIANHSNKLAHGNDSLSELLKDADTLEHYLYNPNIKCSPNDSHRLYTILKELKKNK